MRVTDNEYADPAVQEPKVTDAPETIWLVYGDLEHDDTHRECCSSGEVTWCEDAQFSADVRYVRADTAEAKILALQLAQSELRHDVRAAFEAYFTESRRNRGPSKRPTFELLGDGTYADDHTQRHWWTWQKAAAAGLMGPNVRVQPATTARKEDDESH